jgi:hypothetical protein
MCFKIKLIRTFLLLCVTAWSPSVLADPWTLLSGARVDGGRYAKSKAMLEALQPYVGGIKIERFRDKRDRRTIKAFIKRRGQPRLIYASNGNLALCAVISPKCKTFGQGWRPIFVMMGNTIMLASPKFSPKKDKIKWGDRWGRLPDSMSLALLYGWKNIAYARGFSGKALRHCYQTKDCTIHRTQFTNWLRFYAETEKVLYTQGVWNPITDRWEKDPNLSTKPVFDDVYKGPKNALWRAYKLAVRVRDVLSFVWWVHRSDPNYEVIVAAVRRVHNDKDAWARLIKKTGDYPMKIGKEAEQAVDRVFRNIDAADQKTLATWAREKAGYKAALSR